MKGKVNKQNTRFTVLNRRDPHLKDSFGPDKQVEVWKMEERKTKRISCKGQAAGECCASRKSTKTTAKRARQQQQEQKNDEQEKPLRRLCSSASPASPASEGRSKTLADSRAEQAQESGLDKISIYDFLLVL